VTFYALCSILCLVLNREAAQRIGRHERQYHRLTSILNLGTKRRAITGLVLLGNLRPHLPLQCFGTINLTLFLGKYSRVSAAHLVQNRA
jgi:hypothetical protein